MSSIKKGNFIQAYHRLNIDLVSSLIIKSDFAPEAINKQIKRNDPTYVIDPKDPTTWKYYMNLAGEYHPLDTPMYITSLDTREQILFSPDELFRHTATQEAYQMGSRYYLALLNQYPDQEALIRGALYPCDKDFAIQASEGTILSYRPSLVEENERTLIIELEDYVKRTMSRWYVSAYALTDPYYPAFFFASLSGQILLELLRLRTERCKSEEVHSFHLMHYLGSHNALDKYLPYLDREQQMYLYRNIRYIQRNVGSTAMFHELITMILEKRRIPLTDYTIRQLQDQDSKGYPVVQARRVGLTSYQTTGVDPYIGMDQLFDKESTTAPNNVMMIDMTKESMLHKFKTSNSSVIQIKDLESSMVDLTNVVPDTLEDVFMRQWVTMTHLGLYNVAVNFQDPFTTEDRTLNQWDAVIYAAWLTLRRHGENYRVLPPVKAVKFRRHPRPLVQELQSLIPSDFKYAHLRQIAADMVAAQPILAACYSVKMFYNMTYQIYEECLNQWFTAAQASEPMERGIIEQMANHLFSVAYWDYSNGELIEEWRARNNLPEYNYSNEQAELLIRTIFESATGYRVDETTQMRNIQKAMLDLFADITSYSKQVIREISDGSIMTMGSPDERIALRGLASPTNLYLPTGENAWVTKAKGIDKIQVNDDNYKDFIAVEQSVYHKVPGVVVTQEDPVQLVDKVYKAGHINGVDSVWVKTWTIDSLTGERRLDDPDALIDMPYERALKIVQFNGVQ